MTSTVALPPDLKRLADPFPAEDIEWRIQRAGKIGQGERSGQLWAVVLAYVSNRAIQDRLDHVCGPGLWQNKYISGPSGGVLCGIGIYLPLPTGDHDWIWKWDGAENTDIEPVKGGLSGSMKRAGAQWGIGRYLYNLEAGFASVHANGKHRDYVKIKNPDGKEEKVNIRWDPPDLPEWALPESRRP